MFATPEYNLLVAVLDRAVDDVKGIYSSNRDQLKARRWFLSSNKIELYDFENICDIIGLDADQVRKQLRLI